MKKVFIFAMCLSILLGACINTKKVIKNPNDISDSIVMINDNIGFSEMFDNARIYNFKNRIIYDESFINDYSEIIQFDLEENNLRVWVFRNPLYTWDKIDKIIIDIYNKSVEKTVVDDSMIINEDRFF